MDNNYIGKISHIFFLLTTIHIYIYIYIYITIHIFVQDIFISKSDFQLYSTYNNKNKNKNI